MDVEVLLPQSGMGMIEGTVVEWLNAEGDEIKEGEPLVEIDTAKAVRAVDAPASGLLARVVAHKGDVVPVRGLLGVIRAV
jgi:pyruvate dehydrogenase E2 component (dihydrolipoyllysine-residue acetyltransferase)